MFPATLFVHLDNVGGDCACVTGTVFPITYNFDLDLWSGTAPVCAGTMILTYQCTGVGWDYQCSWKTGGGAEAVVSITPGFESCSPPTYALGTIVLNANALLLGCGSGPTQIRFSILTH